MRVLQQITGINAINPVTPGDPGTWLISRSRQSVLQENRMLANTTNLASSFDFGGLADLYMLDTRQYRAPRPCVDPQRWRTGVKACAEMSITFSMPSKAEGRLALSR